MPGFKLVIFDCDGVLVDSERIANRVFCRMLNDLGIEVTLDDMFERFVGRSMQQCLQTITDLRGSPPPEEFLPEVRNSITAALDKEVVAVEGIEKAIDALRLPYCVASSGEHEKIRLTLGKTGLLPRFEGKIFSVVDVARPKPAPDVFLHAASRMGVVPEFCAVVEDTPTGVLAGVAAGMYVYGYAANTSAAQLRAAGADQVFHSMSDLPALIRGRHEDASLP